MTVEALSPLVHRRPRMISENGNLVFSTGDNKEIRLQPSASGRVRVGDQDLTLLLTQVSSSRQPTTKIQDSIYLSPGKLQYKMW